MRSFGLLFWVIHFKMILFKLCFVFRPSKYLFHLKFKFLHWSIWKLPFKYHMTISKTTISNHHLKNNNPNLPQDTLKFDYKVTVVQSPDVALKCCDVAKKRCNVEDMHLVRIRHENRSELPNCFYSSPYWPSIPQIVRPQMSSTFRN